MIVFDEYLPKTHIFKDLISITWWGLYIQAFSQLHLQQKTIIFSLTTEGEKKLHVKGMDWKREWTGEGRVRMEAVKSIAHTVLKLRGCFFCQKLRIESRIWNGFGGGPSCKQQHWFPETWSNYGTTAFVSVVAGCGLIFAAMTLQRALWPERF